MLVWRCGCADVQEQWIFCCIQANRENLLSLEMCLFGLVLSSCFFRCAESAA